MKRRTLLLASSAWTALAPLRVLAQGRPPKKIGFLMPTSSEPHFWKALKDRLAALGYVEGRDVVYEERSAEARFDRLPALAVDLVRAKPDVIVAAATPPVLAAKAATKTIPIVIATAGDPVKSGAVASLARPGGNVTGISNVANDTTLKTLELARATMPGLSRIAELSNPANAGNSLSIVQDTAVRLGFTVTSLKARTPGELDAAFGSLAKERAEALIVHSDPFLASQRKRITELGRSQRLPVFAAMIELARAGALMGYGADYADDFRRAASFVDRILRGAKPGDLPIEQAATFALVVNRKTAAELGIAIPQSVLLQATEVIE